MYSYVFVIPVIKCGMINGNLILTTIQKYLKVCGDLDFAFENCLR